MSRLPKDIGLLGGIVAFCAGLLVALLCDCPPLAALKKAAYSAALAFPVTWLCAHVAVGVLSDGIRRHDEEANGGA
jgi:hypothetical protein